MRPGTGSMAPWSHDRHLVPTLVSGPSGHPATTTGTPALTRLEESDKVTWGVISFGTSTKVLVDPKKCKYLRPSLFLSSPCTYHCSVKAVLYVPMLFISSSVTLVLPLCFAIYLLLLTTTILEILSDPKKNPRIKRNKILPDRKIIYLTLFSLAFLPSFSMRMRKRPRLVDIVSCLSFNLSEGK